MILAITCEGTQTQNIGFLLRKNPARPQTFELAFGKAYVFYPEVGDARTTVALLLDIEPLDLARGKEGSTGGGLFDYVNDRPYVSSSFMSTALAKVFGTAMTGRSDRMQDLADAKLDLTATVTMLPCRGDPGLLDRIFAPLGYEVAHESFVADENFPDWGAPDRGDCRYVNLTIRGRVRLSDLLHHLYVLIPVFDRQKHYWVGEEEVEKLLTHGGEWLKTHPERRTIARRYLERSRSLVERALERLDSEDEIPEEAGETTTGEANREKHLSLNSRRLSGVVAAVLECGAASAIDLGCGEGNLLELLLKEPSLRKIAATDVSCAALERAKGRIKYEWMSDAQKEKLSLFQGSLTYRDRRFEGYDAACVVEVVEHMDAARLSAFERVLFEHARPRHVILTTPNREYNENYANLESTSLRHGDHRFEWSRPEFLAWAEAVAGRFGYAVRFSGIGDFDERFGTPTQMGVFSLCA